MLGKDSKKNIQFPVQKQGTPSVVVLEDFFNEEFISCLLYTSDAADE